MSKLNELKKHLKEGRVYRRAELTQWSNAVDRHFEMLLAHVFVEKLSPGISKVLLANKALLLKRDASIISGRSETLRPV